MALFKINRGNETNLPETLHDGWAYFCTDTGSLYIDYLGEDGTTLYRKLVDKEELESLQEQLNAINSATKVYAQPNEPTNPKEGDIWIDTDEAVIPNGDEVSY